MKSLIKTLVFVCLIVALQGCTNTISKGPENIDSPNQSTPIVSITETMYPSSTPTINSLNDAGTEDAILLSTPTQVPAGLFLVQNYMPLSLDYDTSLWVDKSEYSNTETRMNHLQSKQMNSCILGPIGASGFYPSPDRIVDLNGNQYEVVEVRTQQDRVVIYYFAISVIDGYDSEISIPVFNVIANASELHECVRIAEDVLSTLHVP